VASCTLAIQNARLFREIEEKSRELEAASRHKSEFLANMSYELGTPLNAIIGFSEVLAEGMFGEINEKQTEYLNDIPESGRRGVTRGRTVDERLGTIRADERKVKQVLLNLL
jgi:signal transduction histidine kinase